MLTEQEKTTIVEGVKHVKDSFTALLDSVLARTAGNTELRDDDLNAAADFLDEEAEKVFVDLEEKYPDLGPVLTNR